jgi:hypothetical protein
MFEEFFVLPTLPSTEKNSSDHHNSYNKGPNPTFFTFTESPSNSILTIKVPKNHITSFNHRNLPKTKLGRPFHGHQTGLRINTHMKFLYPKNMKYTAPLFSNMDVIKVYN